MSPATSFDAIDYVHKLKEAGVPEQQAETHVKILSEIIESNLATKQDIELIRSEMATKIELKKVKVEIIKWNIGAVLTAAGLFIAIFKFFG